MKYTQNYIRFVSLGTWFDPVCCAMVILQTSECFLYWYPSDVWQIGCAKGMGSQAPLGNGDIRI